eukprot:gene19705-23598_t
MTSPAHKPMQKFGVQTDKGKVITAWRNADKYQEEGARIVIHSTKFKTYDQLKVELNKKVGLFTGAVQKLQKDYMDYLEQRKVSKHIHQRQLEHKSTPSTPSATTPSTSTPTLGGQPLSCRTPSPGSKKPVVSSYKDGIPQKFTVQTDKAKVIKAFRNGDKAHSGERITIHTTKFKTLDQLKESMSKQVQLVTGSVRKVYTFDGKLVKSLEDFQDGQNYICCGGEVVDLETVYNVGDSLNIY